MSTTTYEGGGSGFWRFLRELFRGLSDRADFHRAATTVRLPSELSGASFTAAIEIAWQTRFTGTEPGNPEAAVKDHVVARAAEITSRMSVLDPASAQHRLNAEFGHPLVVPGTPIQVLYATVTLAVDAEAKRAAEEHERYRAQLESWRLLRDNVFADPVMTCVWWLDGHPERLEHLPRMDAAFDRLAALTAAGGGGGNEVTRVAQVLHRFIADLDAVDKQRLIETVGYVMTCFGRQDLADDLKAS